MKRWSSVFLLVASFVVVTSSLTAGLLAHPSKVAAATAVEWGDSVGTAGPNPLAVTTDQVSTALQSGATWVNNQEIDLTLASTTIKFTDATACATDGSSGCIFVAQNYGCTGPTDPGTANTKMDIQFGTAANGAHTDLILAAVQSGGDATNCLQLLTGGTGTGAGNNELPMTIANTAAATTTAPAAGAGGTPTLTCDASGLSLSWLICPIVNGVVNAEQYIIDNVLDPLLKTPLVDTTNANASSNYTYQIWSNFRTFGDVLLIIALLVVVFGEAIGGGLIDAYTAKKMLPRILIAAILINLSIYVVAALVDITNVLGKGIEAIILAPFTNISKDVLQIHLSGGLSGASVGALFLGGAALWAGSFAGAGFIALTVILPLVLATIGVIITLLLRQGIILFLIFVSPVAFALYVLPNTEQYFRKWWDLLFKTLLIYPLVGVFFAMATVLGVILNAQGGQAGGFYGVLTQMMSVVALLIPLFLVPFAFRFAGGIVGTIHEQVENHRKRAHGLIAGDVRNPSSFQNRLKGRAGMSRAERNFTGAAIGQRLNPIDRVRGTTKGKLAARREASRQLLGGQYLENDLIWQANRNNDKFLTAHANRKVAEANRDEAIQNGDAGSAAAWTQALNAASQVHGSKATQAASAQAWAGTGYNFSDGRAGYNELAETMSSVTGAKLKYQTDENGNVVRDVNKRANVIGVEAGPSAGAYSNAMNQAQFNLKNAGLYHLGGINDGQGYAPSTGIGKASGFELGSRAKLPTYKGGAEEYLQSSRDFMKLKVTDPDYQVKLNNEAATLRSNLLNGQVKAQDVERWHAKLVEARLSGATGVNKDEIDKQTALIEGMANGLRTQPPPRQEADAQRFAESIDNNRRINRRGINPNEREEG